MNQANILKARPIKAARALLDWSQENLARATGLSIATIRKIELGHISPRDKTNVLIRTTFEDAGIEFIDPNGVRQRPDDITLYQGADGTRAFFDDVYQVCNRTGSDVAQVWPSAHIVIEMLGDYRAFHAERMMAIRDHVKVKCVLTEDHSYLPSPYCEYRFLSRHFVDSVPFYVYGDKYAIVSFPPNEEYKIIVIRSRAAANSFRGQFESMWDRATPLINSGKQPTMTKRQSKRR